MFGSYPPPRTGSFFPEGITTLILLLALVGCASMSVEAGDWERVLIPVTLLGLMAALFGALLAKLNVLDSLAHFLSLVIGIGGSYGLVVLNADELAPGLRQRIRPLGQLILDWYIGHGRVAGQEIYLVSILMGIIVWLVGYMAAWTLFRRGWLLAAVLMPGFLVLINLLYAPHSDKRFLAAYILISIPLAARYHLYRRQRDWARFRMPAPATGGTRFLLIGTVIGILITTAGWQAPASLSQESFQPLAKEMTAQVERLQDRITSLMDSSGKGLGMENAGSYSAFDDAFSVGGALNLSDQPEMLVRSSNAPYLSAQTYDVYSGRGWSTDIDSTFNGKRADGRSYSPAMTFKPGQEVMVSSDVTGARVPSSASITPLTDRDRTLFTIDTYSTASIDTSVQMSWRQLHDQPFTVTAETIGDLPPDLRRVASLLLAADLTGLDGAHGPLPADANGASTLDQEVQQLQHRFLSVRWTADENGTLTGMYVTGQLPVYDDVETVRSREPGKQGSTYQVAGLASTASADELAAAGTTYPDWVTDRYLSLPDSVTSRTRDKAMELAPAYLSPYERAVAIETWLRRNIVYDESVSAPPAGADIVDYVLFERQAGYCEYYASAMAVMLRAVNVPARVVTGYYPGSYDESQRGFVYRQNNAHAWVEAFFPGYGWIPFEPTASRPLMEQGEGQTSEIAPDTAEPTPTQEPVVDAATATPAPVADTTTEPQQPELTPVANDGGVPRWLAIGGAIAIAILGAAVVGWLSWTWRLRGLSPSSSLYMRLVRLARFAGIRSSPAATPHEFAETFARSVPAAREQAERIVAVYELDQYGPSGADASLLQSAQQAWAAMRARAVRLLFGRRRR
ncbi:MAG: transglutaminase domain-containing protein [Thermomicrobiales bacterium]